MPSLAIDVDSGVHTLASYAAKGRSYKCPECDDKVIFRCGEVREAHFAHAAESQCAYTGGEGHTHKTAKILLAHILSVREQVEFRSRCAKCSRMCQIVDVEYKEGDRVVQELALHDGNRADVAMVGPEGVRYIFEVCDTHRTDSPRDEPWFEVNALDVIDAYGKGGDYAFKCIRNRLCMGCSHKEAAGSTANKPVDTCYLIPCVKTAYGIEQDRRRIELARGCDGRGNCLLDNYTHVNSECKHGCKPIKCPTCRTEIPQWVADCQGGTCMNCAVERFGRTGQP